MERQTRLEINSKTQITLRSANGVMGLTLRNGQLFAGTKPLRLTDEKMAEVVAACDAYRPAETVVKYGYEMTDADRQLDWEFWGVENDAHGRFSREISAAVEPVVMIGPMDLV